MVDQNPPAAIRTYAITPKMSMKTKSLIAQLSAGLALALTSTCTARAAGEAASAAQTATLTGRVQNETTGRFLNNARVTVKGTNLRVFTDESGSYHLTSVPTGMIVLEVFYTGLEERQISLNAAAGQSLTEDVGLTPPGARLVQLDPYVVGASKVMDQAAIAINEQRFAPNIKTVVSTGDLAEQVEGNVAEFLKFVPGISTNDTRQGGSEIAVRGFPSNLTEITQDGAATANAPLSGNTRTVSTRSTVSITNVARVEVLKVPTPSTGADTMAGSVNLVSRSAFESPRQFRYQVNLGGSHVDLKDYVSLHKKQSLWENEDIYFARPSLSFTYNHPVSRNFGYTLSGMYDQKGLINEAYLPTFNRNSPTFGSSNRAPFLSGALLIQAGQKGARAHAGATADWRITRNAVLSAGVQTFSSFNQNGDRRISFTTGTIATPTVAGGVPGRFTEETTIGAMGRGAISFTNNAQVQNYAGTRENFRYKLDNGDWKIDAQTAQSSARFWYRTLPDRGTVRNVTASTTIPLRVEFHDIDPVKGPGKVTVFDNNNQVVNPSDPGIHGLTAISGVSILAADVRDDVSSYNLDLRRKLGFLSMPASVQVGGVRRTRDRRRDSRPSDYTYNGPGGSKVSTPFTIPDVKLFDQTYTLVSPNRVAELWERDPSQFFQTPTQIGTSESQRVQNTERIKETADALYFQAEFRLLGDRLNVLTGVRYERTSSVGAGALGTPNDVYVRNADGSFALTPARARIRKPEAGAVGSLEEVKFIFHELASHSQRTYDGYYPSLHFTYTIADGFLARAAYARTYGRPNFSFIIPRTDINEALDTGGAVVGGTLTVRNPGLLPWTADNYDLSLEYYTKQGGVFGAGAFRKDVTNFFGAETRDATPDDLRAVGLDPGGLGWRVVTTSNVGDARIEGVELNMNQSLRPLDRWLGGWGSNFRVFANITKIKLTGDRTADFSGFVPTSANWGVQYTRKRFDGSLKWNYKSAWNVSALTGLGANAFSYVPARTHLDVNLGYSLRPNLALFVQLRNVTRVFQEVLQRSDELPVYARETNFARWEGVSTNVGIKGSF